jgi:catechol 2,3-dioxygenase-like lactoylglutathione lyase family enzyme
MCRLKQHHRPYVGLGDASNPDRTNEQREVQRMTAQRMEHVGIVVDDLAAATAFFVALGLELQGEGPVEGGWVDRVVGLEAVPAEVARMETPGGHGRLELTKFHAPSGPGGNRHTPANTPGIRHVAFAVDDMDAVVARLRAHGAELVGDVERYEDRYRLCYVRAPEGIIVELAEQIRLRAPVTADRLASIGGRPQWGDGRVRSAIVAERALESWGWCSASPAMTGRGFRRRFATRWLRTPFAGPRTALIRTPRSRPKDTLPAHLGHVPPYHS